MKIKKILYISIFVLLCLRVTPVLAATLTLDPTFNSGTGFSGGVPKEPFLVDNGTKYIMAGSFTSYNGTPANGVIKLNLDGSVDTAFLANIGTGLVTSAINGTAIQPDGKLLIATNPSPSFNGVAIPGGLIRLNADGTLDTAFITAIGTSSTDNNGTHARGLLGVDVLSDGTILAMGSNYTGFNGQTANRVFALNSDGTANTAFNANLATGVWVQAGLSQLYQARQLSNGQIIVNGNSTGRSAIFRLNADGSLDNTFNSGGAGANLGVWDTKILSNGKIIIVGQFTTYNGVGANRIAMLNSDGTLDNTSFVSGTGIANNTPTGIAILPSDVFIVGTNISTTYNGVTLANILAINPDGSAPALDFGTGFTSGGLGIQRNFGSINNNGKLLLTGSFPTYNGITVNGILRFNQDFTPPVISNIHIASNHTNQSYAGEGHVVTLSFVSSDVVTGSTVTLGGQSVSPSCSGTAPSITCTATLTITSGIPAVDGLVSFSISLTSEGGTSTTSTTTSDSSSVTVDRVAPTNITVVSAGEDNDAPYYTTDSTPNIVVETSAGDIVTIPDFTCSPTPATGSSVTCTSTVHYNDDEHSITITLSDSAGNSIDTSISLEINAPSSGGGIQYCNGTNTTFCRTEIQPQVSNETPTITPVKPSTNSKTYLSPLDNKEYQCSAFNKYLKLNSKQNDLNEVKLWQAFLNQSMDKKLSVDGVYGKLTFNAVKNFQKNYKDEILTPWNISTPTGYVYKSTVAKANQLLGCQ